MWGSVSSRSFARWPRPGWLLAGSLCLAAAGCGDGDGLDQGAAAGSSASATGGSGCGPAPEGDDCIDGCGPFAPTCVDGVWQCIPSGLCEPPPGCLDPVMCTDPCTGELYPPICPPGAPPICEKDGLTCAVAAEWSASFGDAAWQGADAVAVTPDGSIVVLATVQGSVDLGGGPLPGAGGHDVLVAKLTSGGQLVWAKRFGDAESQRGLDLDVDAAGDLLLAGSVSGSIDLGGGELTGAGGADLFVAKLSPAGDHVWSKSFPSSAARARLAVDPTGAVIVAGAHEGTTDYGGGDRVSAGGADVLVLKLDAGGGHVWSRIFGDADSEWVADVAVDPQGSIALAGAFNGSLDLDAALLGAVDGRDAFTAALSPDGAVLWAHPHGGAGHDEAHRVAADSEGRLTVMLSFGDQIPGGPMEGGLLGLGPDGETRFARALSGPSSSVSGHEAWSLAVDVFGSVIVGGQFELGTDLTSPPAASVGSYDLVLAKLALDGSLIWATTHGSRNSEWIGGVAALPSGEAVVAGSKMSQLDLGNGPLGAAGEADLFLAMFPP